MAPQIYLTTSLLTPGNFVLTPIYYYKVTQIGNNYCVSHTIVVTWVVSVTVIPEMSWYYIFLYNEDEKINHNKMVHYKKE